VATPEKFKKQKWDSQARRKRGREKVARVADDNAEEGKSKAWGGGTGKRFYTARLGGKGKVAHIKRA